MKAHNLMADVKLEEIKDYLKGWRRRLDMTGPDYTIEGGGYIPESIVEELEKMINEPPPNEEHKAT